MTGVPEQTRLRDGDVVLTPQPPVGDVTVFVVEHAGEVAGTAEIRRTGVARGELSWSLYPGQPGQGGRWVASMALRLLLRHAFEELGLVRVEAYVDAGDPQALRIAAGAGLRHEGLLRQRETAGERRSDHAVLARLVDDPDPGTGEGLRATLNSLLPRKRAIAHGVIRDTRGRVLLTEQTIKRQWDLPGGVVEPDESPWQGVVREVQEELGLELGVAGLLAVNWLPSWRQWDDACIFVFDLGVHDAAIVERMTLQATEIRAVHWSDPDLVQERAAAATAELLAEVLGGDLSAPRYLEAGRPPAT